MQDEGLNNRTLARVYLALHSSMAYATARLDQGSLTTESFLELVESRLDIEAQEISLGPVAQFVLRDMYEGVAQMTRRMGSLLKLS